MNRYSRFGTINKIISIEGEYVMPIKEPRFHGEVTERSHINMSRIRGKDTSIEVVLRKALWHRGFRYRKNYKGLPGRPDIVLTKYRIAIFCDSEFFHGKDWQILKPRLEKGKNPDYWVKKIERNIQRDEEKDQQLNFMGWTVIHFWGKDILKDTEQCVRVIEETIFDQKLEEVDDEEEKQVMEIWIWKKRRILFQLKRMQKG